MKNIVRNLIISFLLSFGLLFTVPQFRVFAAFEDEDTQQNESTDEKVDEIADNDDENNNIVDPAELSPSGSTTISDPIPADNNLNVLSVDPALEENNANTDETGIDKQDQKIEDNGNLELTDDQLSGNEESKNESIDYDGDHDGSDEFQEEETDDSAVVNTDNSELDNGSEGSPEMALLSDNASFVSIGDTAETTETTNESDTEYIEGVAYMRGASSGYGDIPVYYHYSDSYFEDCQEIQEDGTVLENAYIYDESLASISAVISSSSQMARFSLSGDEETKYVNVSRNVQDLMRQIGFENITINDAYQSKVEIETIMLIAGKKTVTYGDKEYTLIALFPESGTTDGEWPVNVELGDGDLHEGFEYGASSVLLPFLKDYIETNEITGNVKLWFSGISRAGGFVNTAGGLIDMAFDDNRIEEYLPAVINLEKKNIYIYTFGCPATVSKDVTWNTDSEGNYVERKTEFNHIHNYLNGFDIVIHAVADEWGMDRFGQLHINSMHVSDLAKDEADFAERVQDFCRQYVHMSGVDPTDLTYGRDYMYYDAETDLYHFLGADFRTAVTNDDLETFSRRFMKEISNLVPRDYYKTYIQSAMEIFFGTTYYQMSEIKNAVSAEADSYITKMQETVKELFWKGLRTFDFSELINYIKDDVNPAHSIPQIIINAFKATNTSYNYDFVNHRYDEELLKDENMQKVIWSAMKRAGFGVIDLLTRIRFKDVMTAIDIYQASQAGYDALDSGHVLNYVWTRTYDGKTRSISDIYDIDMSDEDAWGYRMLNLPLELDYSVYVVDEDTGELIYSFDMVNGTAQNAKHFNRNWFVHLGTGDKGIGRVLYLQADHNYAIGFTALASESAIGFSVDEWSSHYYRDIFRPVNHIEADTEDGTAFSDLVISADTARQDQIVLHVGALKSYPKMGESNVAGASGLRLMAASVGEPVQALADYTIEKIIEMLALDGINGEEIINKEFTLSGSDTMEFIAEAIEKTGYIFDGWFAGDELLTNNPVYKTLLSFNDIGKTIVARYHAIPKPDPKPDPKPQPKPDTKPSGKGCTDADKASTMHQVNTDMVNTAASGNTHSRKTVVPNTSDSNLGWLILMLCSLLTASGAVVALKKN